MIHELDNVIQPYAWGSRQVLARMRGEAGPSATPEAELWMGAHPLAPSRLTQTGKGLPELIGEHPERCLGSAVAAKHRARLPFLLKVLAAETPLSLQAHPSRAQAEAGFSADEAAGIALDAPERNYKDRNHKPELLCALDEFWALCGFRTVAATLELLAELGVAELEPYAAMLRSQPNAQGLEQAFSALYRAEPEQQRLLVERTAAACRSRSRPGSRFGAELGWAARLSQLYPGDIGLVAALLLNLLRLEPGEALYLPAGNLHAYLGGSGVEIMASSDNVLRGGLTPKHVNVPELLRVLDFEPLQVAPIRPVGEGAEHVYLTPAREFRLSYLEPAGAELELRVSGPEIFLATGGAAELRSDAGERVQLGPCRSAFVSADTGRVLLSGTGRIFRAAVPHSD